VHSTSPKYHITQALTYRQGHDAELPHILKLESVTVAPTKADPHNCRVVYSFTVPKKLCNMGGTLFGHQSLSHIR